jgi:DNA processing protein
MKDNYAICRLEPGDASYPRMLGMLPRSPILYKAGAGMLPSRAVGIVGTRRASDAGRHVAYAIAQDLARRGIAIISGLAFGIDEAAHRGALDAQGVTWAVMAQGLDEIYPRAHEALAGRILASGGCLVSEYPPRTPSYPNHFIARNRIISGISDAVIVIEAPAQSGALATARFAAEQGRDVYVVPGPFNSPLYAGSHALIRDGARLVHALSDLCEDLDIEGEGGAAPEDASLSPHETLVLEALRATPQAIDVDNLLETTKLKPQEAQAALSSLVLKGIACEDGIQRYRAV